MKMLLIFVFLPALVFSCCPPKQWQGKEYVAMGSVDTAGNKHYVEIDQDVTVDSTRRMVFVDQKMMYDGQPVKQQVLLDYSTATQYVTRDGKCEKMGITTIEPGCIPENATTLHSYMGVGNSKIMTTVYRFTVGYMNTYITVADDGCIPMVMESSGQDALGGSHQTTVETFGITPGITDSSVFTIPTTCDLYNPTPVGVGRR